MNKNKERFHRNKYYVRKNNKIKIFLIARFPKEGLTLTDCEDNYSISKDLTKIAVSDGATEAVFSSLWSKILTDHFIKNPVNSDFCNDYFKNARKTFAESIKRKGDLPWYVKNKLEEQGSSATFLGIEIKTNSKEKKVIATAIGDTTLFFINEKYIVRFPQQSSEEFKKNPYLINVIPQFNEDVASYKKSIELPLEAGNNRIYLMTDSIGFHCHKFFEVHSERIKKYLSTITMNKIFFENTVIKSLRNEKKEIKNDDITCIVIDIFI